MMKTLTSAASGALAALGKKSEETRVVVQVNGSYTGLQFTVQGSVDGSNWKDLAVVNEGSGQLVTGTISPSDTTVGIWKVVDADGLDVRINVSAQTGGTATWTLQSYSVVGGTIFQNNAASVVAGAQQLSTTSGNALTAGANGTTNPAFNVDASVASQATGVNVVGRAAGAGVTLGVTSSGTNEDLLVAPKGTGGVKVTSNGASALAIGANGGTNPALQVDASTASSVTGVKVKSAAAGAGVAVSVVSSGANEALTLDAKGSGNVTIGGTSTGIVSIGRGSVSVPVFSSTKTTVSAQNSTPTAAQLLGGYIDHNSATGAGTATLDTGTNIDTAIPGVATGDSFQCCYVNRGSQVVTITTNTGLTLRGTAAIPAGKNALLDFFRTGAGAWDVAIDLSA
jgi:hypothetical protein